MLMHSILLTASFLLAQSTEPADPVVAAPKPLAINATIESVTLYQGRAAVTRSASVQSGLGVWEARFADLPPTVVEDSLQATIAAPAKLLDVRFETRSSDVHLSTDTRFAALNTQIEELEQAIGLATARQETVMSSVKLLDALATRVVDQTSKGLASDAVDPEKFAAQIASIAEQREALLTTQLAIQRDVRALNERLQAAQANRDSIGGAVKTSRTGIVTFAMATDSAAPLDVQLTYLVIGATWTPSYSVRAAGDLSGLQVDYDAVIKQRTGESWENVQLTLSTAQPTHAAAPPELQPIHVDLYAPMRQGVLKSVVPPPASPGPAAPRAEFSYSGESDRKLAEDASREASVTQSATAATFTLPRTVSLASDVQRDQKTRIATLDLKPTYTYITRPAVDPAAYLRGTTRNSSAHQLLAGRARVFLGGDSVGVTDLEDIAPGGEFELWFGADKRIEVERKLIARNTSTSGIISKDAVITWQRRITLKNGIPAATSIEVWDVMPVARHEDITVTLREVSPALATDKVYEANEKKQGFLKWSLTLPAKPHDGAPGSISINWTVMLSRPEKAIITPLSD